jgi:hypothetical protein
LEGEQLLDGVHDLLRCAGHDILNEIGIMIGIEVIDGEGIRTVGITGDGEPIPVREKKIVGERSQIILVLLRQLGEQATIGGGL